MMLNKLSSSLLALAAVALVLSAASADARVALRASKAAADCGPNGCDAPCISYRSHGRCKTCCSCEPPIQTVIAVEDPCCCGRIVEIPVCIPACCTGEPCITSRCGLFHRGIVRIDYDCGFSMRVVFDKHGDVTVHYYGR